MVMHTHLLKYPDPIVYTSMCQDTHLAEYLLDGQQARALLKHHLTQSCLSKHMPSCLRQICPLLYRGARKYFPSPYSLPSPSASRDGDTLWEQPQSHGAETHPCLPAGLRHPEEICVIMLPQLLLLPRGRRALPRNGAITDSAVSKTTLSITLPSKHVEMA